ncbi:diaminopimelate epimerase [Iodidimonas muriae]|uniref:Diaminopimelate epimerase n=1 Tax=Iodidimonas muriae TaxID=261467 RepID=A0ABQ2LDR6_9PROT|nr:diaminopimelate epimerase [Iodidimonas muriae]GER07887.1 diaminopimelate epimerase [Kordiimonadales bacterium JCM 17843]GGO12018.1 diaminopimelate epimerase [Iodidimonas muriae]
MTNASPLGRPFIKMHGLGNDFIVFDAREIPLALTDDVVRALSDRQTGIGCDQLIVLHPDKKPDAGGPADLFMEIRNADGSTVAACGNATRCVARLILEETGRDRALIRTCAGLLAADRDAFGIRVDMGRPGFHWQDLPLSHEMDTLMLDLHEGGLSQPTALSMGNPHLLFFLEGGLDVDVRAIGSTLEHHPWFPEAVNVSFVRVLAPDHLSVATWERGAGLTRACGTGACASLVGAHRRGYAGRAAQIDMSGGTLHILWDDADHVLMSGDADIAFHGRVALPLGYGA